MNITVIICFTLSVIGILFKTDYRILNTNKIGIHFSKLREYICLIFFILIQIK